VEVPTVDITGLDAANDTWLDLSYNLLDNGQMETIGKAFKMQPAEIVAAIIPRSDAGVTPTEGKIAFGLTQPDGTVSYDYSANGIGFWMTAQGARTGWGNNHAFYFEYDNAYTLNIGHLPPDTEAGTSAVNKGDVLTFKPTLVLTKDGKQYKAVMTIKLHF
jgi:hypothetical protein